MLFACAKKWAEGRVGSQRWPGQAVFALVLALGVLPLVSRKTARIAPAGYWCGSACDRLGNSWYAGRLQIPEDRYDFLFAQALCGPSYELRRSSSPDSLDSHETASRGYYPIQRHLKELLGSAGGAETVGIATAGLALVLLLLP